MTCVRALALVAILSAPALAAGINTNAALRAGKGETALRTAVRYADLEAAVEQYLAEEALVYGLTPRLTLISRIAYAWNDPGPSGLGDLEVSGRFQFWARDEKRGTLSFAGLAGVELPVGDSPLGSEDGGVLGGFVATFERIDWRVDADVIGAWRPHDRDALRADVAVANNFLFGKRWFLIGVVELNYRDREGQGVLYLAPGIVYEGWGFKLEFTAQIRIADDSKRPVADTIFGLIFTKVF